MSAAQVLAEAEALPCQTCSSLLRQAALKCFESPKALVLPGNIKVSKKYLPNNLA